MAREQAPLESSQNRVIESARPSEQSSIQNAKVPKEFNDSLLPPLWRL